LWTTRAPLQTPRGGLAVAALDHRLYAVGGADVTLGIGADVATMEAYDPATDLWTTRAPMSTPRQDLTLVALDGRLYAVGGAVVVYAGGTQATALATVEVYDPATDVWTTRASLSIPRYSHGAAALDHGIYAVGGYNGTSLATVEV